MGSSLSLSLWITYIRKDRCVPTSKYWMGTYLTSGLGMEKIGESSTGIMDVGLQSIAVGVTTVSPPAASEASSPVLILSSSDLFTYFLPYKHVTF